MADAPRIAYPLRLHAGGATTVEQDSVDDLVSSALFALRTPPGWLPEAPGFGVADPVFSPHPTADIVNALEAGDPRLAVAAEEVRDAVSTRIRLLIGGDTA